MKKNIMSAILISLILFSCGGPSGVTKKDRLIAEKHYKNAATILNKSILNLNDLNRAYQELEKSIHGFTDDERMLAEVYAKQGRVLFLKKHYSKAVNKLSKSLKLNKRKKKPYILLVKIFLIKRNNKNAFYWAKRGSENISKNSEFHYYIGKILFFRNKYRASEEMLQKAIDAGISGRMLSDARTTIRRIRKLMRSGITRQSADLAAYLRKSILTFGEVADIINKIVDIKNIAQSRNYFTQFFGSPYELMRKVKIYDKRQFFKDKYVSRGDFSYILCNLIGFLKQNKLKVKEKYSQNPGIPDLERNYYAFSHILYIVEQNFMQIKDNGNFGVNKNLSADVCIKAIKTVKNRFSN